MKKISQKKKSVIFALFLAVFSTAFCGVFAKDLEQNYPGFLGRTLDKNTTLTGLVAYIYNLALAIGGISLFVMMVFSGVKYITSAGDPGKAKEAKEGITSAILGLILLFASFLILNTINPALTSLDVPGLKTCTTDADCCVGVPAPCSYVCVGAPKGLCGYGIPGITGLNIPQNFGPDSVALFENKDYPEEETPLIVGAGSPIPDLSAIQGGWDNAISSMKLAENVNHVLLCLNKDYVACEYFDEKEISTLEGCDGCGSGLCGGFHNVVSSVRVGLNPATEPCDGVTLYELGNRQIDCHTFCPGTCSEQKTCTENPCSIGKAQDSKFFEYKGGITRYDSLNTTKWGVQLEGNIDSFSISGDCVVKFYKNADCSGGGDEILFSWDGNNGKYNSCEQEVDGTYNCVNELKKYPRASGGDWQDDVNCIEISANTD